MTMTNNPEYLDSYAEDDNYWQAYGLTRDPFARDSEQAFHALAAWEEHLDVLQHLSAYSNVLLTVTGENGSGKSTLMQQFKSRLEEDVQNHIINGNSQLDANTLLNIISREFAIPIVADLELPLTDKVNIQIENLQSSGQHYLLIVDDAHLLPESTLTVLFNLVENQPDDRACLHVALFGEGLLQRRLAHIAGQAGLHNLLHHVELQPLNLAETNNYLTESFLAAGLQTEMPLSVVEVERIHQMSGGNISRINEVARRLLSESSEQQVVGGSFWDEHRMKIIGGLVFLTALVMAATGLSQYGSDEKRNYFVIEKILPKNETKQAQVTTPAQPTTTPQVVATQPQQPVAPAAQPVVNLADAEREVVLTNPEQTLQTEQKSMIVIGSEPEYLDEPAAPPLPEKKVIVRKPVQQQPTAVAVAKKPEATVVKPVAAKPVPVVKPQVAKVTTKPRVAKATTTKPAVKTVAKKKAATLIYTQDERRLLATQGNYYTLQLLGTSQRANLERFIEKNNLAGKASYFRSKRGGKNWYVLVYGKYPDATSARAALAKLPAEIRNLKPWPRSYTKIHQEIREHNSVLAQR